MTAYEMRISDWSSDGCSSDRAPAADADAVWLPGGYPELHAGRIAQAAHFLSGLRRHALDRPIHGECGGYMALGEALIDADGQAHATSGIASGRGRGCQFVEI